MSIVLSLLINAAALWVATQVVDGIYCHCGCAELDGSYSLLSCYEGGGMAQACQVCQGEGRMVYELHKKGKKLDDIRAAIDRNFG